MTSPTPLHKIVVALAISHLGKYGHHYSDRKVYTLAEFDWNSTYGFGEGGSSPEGAMTPAGIYMLEGSPRRGVLLIISEGAPDFGWMVRYSTGRFTRRFTVKPDEFLENQQVVENDST